MGTFSINEGVVIRGRTALSWDIVAKVYMVFRDVLQLFRAFVDCC